MVTWKQVLFVVIMVIFLPQQNSKSLLGTFQFVQKQYSLAEDTDGFCGCLQTELKYTKTIIFLDDKHFYEKRV